MNQSFKYILPPNSSISDLAVVCLADTHSQQVSIPPGDILIHAGDLSKHGKPSEIQDTLSWLAAQPHSCKVVIAGNADLALDQRGSRPSTHHFNWHDIVYLCESTASITFIDGTGSTRTITMYGNPFVPRCGPDEAEAFQYDVGEDYWQNVVPLETDIMVTHTPPKSILDRWDNTSEGCQSLWQEVQRVRPKLHVFGHVHPGSGQLTVRWLETTCKDVDDNYKMEQNTPTLVDNNTTDNCSAHARETVFVNAACASADGKTMANKPRIVYI